MLPAGTSRFLCLLSVLLCVCASRGQQCNDKDGFYARHGIGLEELNGEVSKMSRDAYRLTSLSAYADVDQPRYAATWVKTSAAGAKQQILPKLTLAELNAQLASTTAFCIKSITGYTVAGTDFYAAVWDAPASGGSCPEVDVRPAMTRDAYLQQFESWRSTHYPTWINRYADGAKIATIYTRNGAGIGPTDWETRDNQDFATFAANNQQLTDRGYRLMVVSGFRAGFDGYAAIWWRGGGFRADRAWEVHVGLSAENYQCKFDNLMYSGFVPLYVNANSGGAPARYQAIFELQGLKAADMAAIDKIVADYTLATPLPSLSVALAKGGRIRFARSWGYADKNNGRFACPTSAYRVASVSKPITSTGIFKLVQQGKLALNNKVVGEGALLGTKYGTLPYKQYVQDITVQHLLEHTAGGEAWTNNDKDPMFDPDHINLSQAELIKWVLDTRTIAKPPGTDFFYSNFGYMLLARVIEEVTQQGYEDWIRANVLKAQSAEGMFIAGSALADRRPNEVVYEDSFDPYASNAHRMDGHGGWAGSALDALRFTLGVDGMRAVGGEVLASAQYSAMLTPVAVNNKYARGWAVRATGGTDHWHTGRMPGTNTEIAVLFDSDISHAILTNTRTPNDSVLELIHAIRKAITVWPCIGWDAGASGFVIPRTNQQPVEIVRRPTECPECGFRDVIVRPDLLAPVASTSLLSQNQPALTSFDG